MVVELQNIIDLKFIQGAVEYGFAIIKEYGVSPIIVLFGGMHRTKPSVANDLSHFESPNDEQSGIMAVGLLKDKADTWYREPPLGWLTSKRLLKEFFCPENSELLAR